MLKYFREKSGFIFRTRIPLASYTQSRFGILDFNQREFENYQRLAEVASPQVHHCFSPVRWVGHYRGRSASLSDLVLNDDGAPAQPLAKYSAMIAPQFWETMDELEDFLLTSRLYFPDVNAQNILVQFRQGIPQPVFIDYKRLGAETYPCQFWLRHEAALADKMRRKFERLRMRFRPS